MSENSRPEGDLIECECGVTFAALRCPALDCQKEQPGMRLVTEADWKVLEACAALKISTDAIGPISMNGKPQICSSTSALAAAEYARRAK